tara:strand:- start:15 stop:206 length:192 start_codon:yes stop_codon:yes gene_type:complete
MKIIIQESFEGEFKSIDIAQLEHTLQQVSVKAKEQLLAQIKSAEDDGQKLNVDSSGNIGSNSD